MLLSPCEAAQRLGISCPPIKQRLSPGKLRAMVEMNMDGLPAQVKPSIGRGETAAAPIKSTEVTVLRV